MNRRNKWEEILKNQGLRCTEQRLVILDQLAQNVRPISAQELFDQIRYQNSKYRLSTVYRNLNLFEEKKIVRRINLDYKESIFELALEEHHHHLLCMKCAEIIALDCPLKEYEEELQRKTKYTILDHKLKLYGICPKCNNRSETFQKNGGITNAKKY